MACALLNTHIAAFLTYPEHDGPAYLRLSWNVATIEKRSVALRVGRIAHVYAE